MWPEDWPALAFEKQVHGQIGPAISHNEAQLILTRYMRASSTKAE
jgi:hypothetical protein